MNGVSLHYTVPFKYHTLQRSTMAGTKNRSQVTGHCFTYTESILNIVKAILRLLGLRLAFMNV